MERSLDIVAAGHICLDIIPKFPKDLEGKAEGLFLPGKLINVEEAAISTGGPVSNTGLALQRLGIKVEFMGKVGNDLLGKVIIDLLSQAVSRKGMKVVEGQASSYTVAIAPPDVDRIFLHNPGTNDTFGYDDVNFDIVAQAKLFHLGYPPLMRRLYENNGEELTKIFKKAKELGVTTSLDTSLPDPKSTSGKVDWRIILEKTLPYVDIFLPSAEEILYMLDKDKFLDWQASGGDKDILAQLEGEDLSRLSGQMLDMGVKIAAIKCGYRGFYVRTASEDKLSLIGYAKPGNLENWSNRELWEPSYYVEQIASATGSGDSSIAGFLAACLRGESIERSLKYACALGAQNIRVLDAVSGIKDWEQTTSQVESNRTKNKLQLGTPGWIFDDQGQAWKGPKNAKRSNNPIEEKD